MVTSVHLTIIADDEKVREYNVIYPDNKQKQACCLGEQMIEKRSLYNL